MLRYSILVAFCYVQYTTNPCCPKQGINVCTDRSTVTVVFYRGKKIGNFFSFQKLRKLVALFVSFVSLILTFAFWCILSCHVLSFPIIFRRYVPDKFTENEIIYSVKKYG